MFDPVATLAHERELEPGFLRELGVTSDGASVLIPYLDYAGKQLFVRRRNPPGVAPRFAQPAGKRLVPYGLWRLDRPREEMDRLYLTEGETDAWAMWAAGYCALGLPGAQSVQCLEARCFLRAEWIGICRDNDPAGAAFAAGVRDRLVQLGFLGTLVAIPMPDGVKDVCALRMRDPENFRGAMLRQEMRAVELLPTRRTEEVRCEETGGWPALIPLGRLPDVPAFPIRVLPLRLQTFVDEVSRSLSCPEDYAGVSLLVVASGAIGASRAVGVTASHVQSACLFGAVVGSPGCAKSPALKMVVEPMRKAERLVQAAWKRARKEYEVALEAHEAGAKNRGKKDPTPAPTPPVLTRYTVNDATTESLVPILRDNPRGFVMVRDELVGWVASMNQYRDRGRGADQQFWLSVWSGEDVVVDRKKTHEAGPLTATRPFVSVIGSLTPDKLPTLRGDRGRGPVVLDGFIDRILVSYPPEMPAVEEGFLEVDDGTKAMLRRVIDRLLGLGMRATREDDELHWEPVVIPLDDAGREVMREWTRKAAEERSADDFPPALVGVWSKMRGYLGRLALVIRCLRWADGEVADLDACVEAEDVRRAALLADYFQAHARKVHVAMDSDPNTAAAARVLRWVRRKGVRTFSRREAYNVHRGTFKTPDELDPVLDLMEQHGYIRRNLSIERIGVGRKPSPTYETNPTIHAQNTHFTQN